MREFKAGDRVRILPDVGWSAWFRPYVGAVLEVTSTDAEAVNVKLPSGGCGRKVPKYAI